MKFIVLQLIGIACLVGLIVLDESPVVRGAACVGILAMVSLLLKELLAARGSKPPRLDLSSLSQGSDEKGRRPWARQSS